MTLNTTIRVLDAVPVRPLAAFLHNLVGGKGDLKRGDAPYRYESPWLGTPWGVGNSAHVDVWYGADGPLLDVRTPVEDDGPKRAFIEIALDTGYGYRDDRGGCTALHGRLITALAEGPLNGKRFAWENEYTGEWFTWGTEECSIQIEKWLNGGWG